MTAVKNKNKSRRCDRCGKKLRGAQRHWCSRECMPTTEERFWEKVAKVGCWEWLAGVDKAGYGVFSWNGRSGRAHRYAWELLRGPIPEGLHIDHLCRNRACVNPDHLEPVSQAENNRRGWGRGHNNSLKLCCPNGHAYSPENTYVRQRKWGPVRICKTCHARQSEAARKRRLARQQAERALAREAA